MKRVFFIVCFLAFVAVYAQSGKYIIVSILKQSISAPVEGDNGAKVLNVHANTRLTEHLKILNGRYQDEKEWKRSFELFDSTDKAVLKIPAVNQSAYQVTIKQLRSQLRKGAVYSLYTIALPKDPDLAARVRVRRVLVCKINMK
ncbi:hypothetical protein EXU57_21015 [Segetibacter sp. 3557_3]|uniref:hypothetical protein n=1 Tax=Segetibacter sp. 3557_3 TaxID=2547429 RepID=UPI0010586A15|nr:hypothetical protein [Segetibacter sp. 3557_3]TDH20876.1 hypothetical protein EXU57_21015 [Segetibacter sp. 3557_3]